MPMDIITMQTGNRDQKGLSESQTLKTTIHETAHAKLHDKEIMESLGVEKDRLTKEVEAESVAYCVCSSFGFGYIGLQFSLYCRLEQQPGNEGNESIYGCDPQDSR